MNASETLISILQKMNIRIRYFGDETRARSPELKMSSMQQVYALLMVSKQVKVFNRQIKFISGDFIRVFKNYNELTIEIHAVSIQQFQEIKILIETMFPHIFFTDNEQAWGYDYLLDRIKSASFIPTVGELVQAYNGRCQIEDLVYSDYNGGWTTGKLLEGGGSYLGGLNSYELAFFTGGDGVYARRGNDVLPVGLLSATISPELSGAYGPMFGVVGHKGGTPWNLHRGSIVFAVNPINGAITQPWVWVPSFFTMEPANGHFFFPGWYYGYVGALGPNSEYGWVGYDVVPLTGMNVNLVGMLDAKSTKAGIKYGWCEQVSRVEWNGETEDRRDLFFYLYADGLPTASINTTTYVSSLAVGDPNSAQVTMGADLTGFKPEIRILDVAHAIEHVAMWSFFPFYPEDTELDQQKNAVGIVIQGGGSVTVYRYKGYLTPVFSGGNYHSHSVSRDGTILALFFGAETIESVKVFNLFGPTIKTLKSSSSMASLGASEGELIPYRTASPLPTTLSGGTIDSADHNGTFSPLGTLSFPKNGKGQMIIHKLACADGVHARYDALVDACFDSYLFLSDPDPNTTPLPWEKLVGYWEENFGSRGLVRGDFVGSGKDIRFHGTGEGTYVTLHPLNPLQDGYGMSIEGYLGGEFIEGAFRAKTPEDFWDSPDYILQDAGIVRQLQCDGEADALVESTCGQRQTVHMTKTITPLMFTPPADNQTFVTGGTPPYSFSISCGAIDDAGLITSTTGCCGTGTVTVTDDCGATAEMPFKYPIGQWVVQSCIDGPCHSGWCEANTENCSDDVEVDIKCSTINGETKTTYRFYSGISDIYGCNPTTNCLFLNAYSSQGAIPCGSDTFGSAYFPKSCGPTSYKYIGLKSVTTCRWECNPA